MAIAAPPIAPPHCLTYEAYMAEETTGGRYDIIDGVRELMPGATDAHQDEVFNIAEAFRAFERQYRLGKARIAPRDVLVSRVPLRTRQPDVFFISSERQKQNPARNDAAPMTAAPELVVEVISDSETERRYNDKIADYCAVDVKECWKVLPVTQTVEVYALTANGAVLSAAYGAGETILSRTFPDLTVAVNAIFAE